MLDVKLKLKPSHTGKRTSLEALTFKQLFWNVTYACNYRCGICFTDSGCGAKNELTTAEADALILRAAGAGVEDIIISGGEPFMRPDMLHLLGTMARVGITARIASNGSLLDDATLDRLKAETLTKSFQISLDSLDPDVYARMHRAPSDSLSLALRALEGIQRRGFHTTVSLRLTADTLGGVIPLLDRAAAEGWSTVTIHWPLHTRRATSAFAQDADFFTLLEPGLEHFAGLADRWLVETYIPWAPYHPVMKRLASRVTVVHRGCRAGRDRLTINPTGDLSPCVCLDVPAATLGNVRTHDLLDVYETAPICQMLQHPVEHGICSDCKLVATCGGGCRAAAYATTGRIDGEDTSCPLRQRRTALPIVA